LNVRDRIIGFSRVRASELKANPSNPRQHDEREREVFGDLLSRIGFAGALLAYRNADGELELVDGALRKDLMEDQEVPVLETDLTPDEARELLLFFDRVAGMATYNPEITLELVERLNLNGDAAALAHLADEMEAEAQIESMSSEANPETAGGTSQPGGRKKRGEDTGPTPIKAVISVFELQIVERALSATQEKNRGTALSIICQAFLNSIGETN